MKVKAQKIEILKRKLSKINNFCDLPDKTESQRELIKFAESLIQKIDFEKIDKEIDKKYLQVLNYFDYDLKEIKGTGYFMLYDRQCSDSFHSYNLVDSLENAVDNFGEHWFEDHNLDIEKVFNDKIIDFNECILEFSF